jgi:hypothetical protein
MNTRCIHIYNVYNTYTWNIQLLGNMLFSGSLCSSRAVWVLHSRLDTLQVIHGYQARQLIVKCIEEESSPLPVTD